MIDPDIWFHMAGGRWILQHGFPKLDPLSYPSAGQEYIDLHWVFQIFARAVHAIGREPGLVLMSCLAVTAAWLLAHHRARRHAPAGLAAVLTALGAVLMSERMSPRPEILSFLFLALWCWLVDRRREGWGPARWILPALMALWVNTEGIFVLGFLVLGAALLDAPRDRRLWRTAAICAAATLINPWFLEGATHPLVLFTRVNRSLPVYSQTIGEFRSPFQDEPLYPAIWLFRHVYLPLLPLALLWLLLRGRRPRLGELLIVAATTYLAVSARRNIALAPLLTVPVLARWIADGWAAKRRPEGALRFVAAWKLPAIAGALAGLAMAAYLLGLATNRIYARAETNRRFGTAPAEADFARGAARFLTAERVEGPLFSTFAAGSYFTWALPQEKVFIDGRLEVHTAQHYERYLRMVQGGAAWAEADRQYRFNAAVVEYMVAMPLALERLGDPEWAPVFLDEMTLVFARRNGRNAALIERRGITLERLRERFPALELAAEDGPPALPAPPSALARLFTAVRLPWTRMNLGQLLIALNRPAHAAPELAAAVRQAPGLGAPRVLLASALNGMGRPPAALAVLETADGLVGTRAGRARAWIVRGDILERLDRPGEAVAAYDRCLELLDSKEDRPQVGAVLSSRANAKLRAGDLAGAAADIAESLRILPGSVQAQLHLARIEEARGRREAALEAFRRVAAGGGRTPEVEEALRRLGG